MSTIFSKTEHKILKFWKKEKIFAKLQKKNKGKKPWSFLDGPITANNPMGVHHAWGRTYKDAFQRYKAMRGFDQRFQNGFDCQGLWVEVEVEKELGFKNKKDIENYGIAKFVSKCKQRVKKYSKIQTKQSVRLGQWMDWENSYYTMSDENNYAIWHFLKTCWKKGWLYKGHDVVPWCPRCGTAISQHEILTEEYKELTHKAVFVKLPLRSAQDKPNKTYLLIWTTTPWTLIANIAVAVNPKINYIKAKKDDEYYIIAKSRFEILGKEYKKAGKVSGENLIGQSYIGPFDQLLASKKPEHKVISWDEVSEEEGTGLVHIAPGCGQEDFQLGKENKLDVIDPIDGEARYKEGFGFLSGKKTSQVNNEIFGYLKDKGFLFKIQDYTHRYPTCWRCKSELVFRLVDEWYIKMDDIREPLKKIAKKIKWIPEFGLPREIDWLNNMHDWLISKKRYWGLALPIFECSCGHFEVIGGYKELKKRAVSGWKSFDGRSPHKPQVDKVKIKCSKCGKLVSRIPDVGNPWLDAGIVSLSTMKYFTNRKYWQKWFPADFICESFPGQFRNWFYALIAMSGVLENEPPTKTIFGYATVVDEKGEEMHKSKGNSIDFSKAVETIGADIMRWLYMKQNPSANLRFGFKSAEEARRKILILWNSFLYFQTYTDKSVKTKTNPTVLDKWIISRLNSLILKTTNNLDEYNMGKAVQDIEDFIINDISTWYIRRSRQRFQNPDSKEELASASKTLKHILLETIKLTAPIMPFLSEEIYQSLRDKKSPRPHRYASKLACEALRAGESVHLCNWPKANQKLINQNLESKMKKIRELSAEALAQRADAGIKIRQPLPKLSIDNKKIAEDRKLTDLLKEEVNVKNISYGKKIKLDTKITPELKAEGNIREIVRTIQGIRKKAGLNPGQLVNLEYKADLYLKDLIEKNKEEIKKQTSVREIKLSSKIKEQEFDIDNHKILIGIRK